MLPPRLGVFCWRVVRAIQMVDRRAAHENWTKYSVRFFSCGWGGLSSAGPGAEGMDRLVKGFAGELLAALFEDRLVTWPGVVAQSAAREVLNFSAVLVR